MGKRPLPLLATAPVRAFLAVLAFLLVSWPVVSIAGSRGLFALFGYVFAAWAGLVVLLALIGKAADCETKRSDE